MRLFLSSYQFGQYTEVFQSLVGDDAKIGVIGNARDYNVDTERAESVTTLLGSFKDIGFDAYEIDLRHYFTDATGLAEELQQYDVLWLAGGNTFVLVRALRMTGSDILIRKLVIENKVIYGGESAGAVVATPTLTGVEFGDDLEIVPDGYADEEVWDGLGLVSYAVVPHYESEWEGYERMIEVLEDNDIPYKTLTDFQAIVVNGDEEMKLL